MADDDRKSSKRERREEARQRRLEEMRRRERKQQMRKLVWVGVAVLVVGGIVAAVLASRGSSKKALEDLDTVAAAAGCAKLQTLPDEGRQHKAPYSFKTNPPTSGNHAAATASTGVLSTAAPDEQLVHNMEHGHVLIWYKADLDGAILDDLKSFVRSDDRRLVLIPRADMPYQLAFTAWARLMGCDSPNAKAVDAAKKFAAQFKGKGPEGDIPGSPI